ncbi:MAG TPA: RNA polymerase sigma factor region1.1 domain-containing protein [Myxococcales bacterium]
MSTLKIGRSHKARKALFTRGIRRGFLSIGEIDQALPPGSMSDAERWLLFYSLHAAKVEVVDDEGRRLELEELRRSASDSEGEEASPDQH